MDKLIVALIIVGSLILLASYETDKSNYNPEEICKKQKDLSQEQCLHAIHYAQAAGY